VGNHLLAGHAGRAPCARLAQGHDPRALLSRLDEASQATFLAELGPRLAAAYPADADGTVLFPFRRIFIIAQA
jgi:trans-aconitate 2-methyltransferase